jgi:ATP-dependent DNA ligase
MFAGFEETLDGEWVLKEGKYYAFDLPDHPGDFDERSRALRKVAAFKISGLAIVDSYGGHFARIYTTISGGAIEGVVFKRRSSLYAKQPRASAEIRTWLKRRFAWD